MDDFLALMEETPPTEESETANASLDRNRGSPSRSTSRRSLPQNNSIDQDNGFAASFNTNASPPEPQQQQQLSLNVDERVGIRMIKRSVSSIDLMDMISENPYHSAASLSAMSLTALNRILIDPAVVLDPANVCGRTGMVTVGIVFTNSGTRVAASGNAFCVLTIGNLRTGPAVSVMLFGSAYSGFCRTCVPGKVIALVSPRLIPSKAGSGPRETSVTFSLNDEHQLKLVADAKDFGVCKATLRGKRDDGQWVSDAKRCKQFVDTRTSEFCQMHRKQANIKGDPAKGTMAMQQLRLESRVFPTAQGRGMAVSSQGAILGKPTQEAARSTQMMAQFQSRTTTGSNLRGVPMQMTKQPTNNSILAPRNQVEMMAQFQSRKTAGSNLRGVPMQMTKQPTNNTILAPRSQEAARSTQMMGQFQSRKTAGSNLRGVPTKMSKQPTKNSLLAPRNQASKTPLIQSQSAPRATQPAKNQPVKHDWLQGSSKRPGGPLSNASSAGNKRRAVNTDVMGFNGTVPVPKASALFAGGPAVQSSTLSRTDIYAQRKEEKAKEQMFSQQKELSARLREQNSKAEGKPRPKGNLKSGGTAQQKAAVDSRQAQRDSLFGSLDQADIERIASKKSRFSKEADAEDYARSRRVVSELEKEESKKEYQASKTNKLPGNGETGSIKTEWFCPTCRQTFYKKPVVCYTSKHPVKMDRKIQVAKSIGDKRTALSDKSAEDGGLKLGSGLEWSRWNMNRFG